MKFLSSIFLCTMAMVKPIFSQVVKYQVGGATLPGTWLIENGQSNNVPVGFVLPTGGEDGVPFLSATAAACSSATGFSLGTVSGTPATGLTVQLTNTAPVVSTTYCFTVTLSFQFTAGPSVLHVKTFSFTYTANADGSVTPSPVENINGFIEDSDASTGTETGSSVTRASPTVTLSSTPTSQVTFNQDVTLTVTPGTGFTGYYFRIESVTGMTPVSTFPAAWGLGTATGVIRIPIASFVGAGQGGQITITAIVGWSVTNPARRLIRGLQDENEDIPPSGTATYDVTISLDPASVEAAANAGGFPTYHVSMTLIAATGAMAAVAF